MTKMKICVICKQSKCNKQISVHYDATEGVCSECWRKTTPSQKELDNLIADIINLS